MSYTRIATSQEIQNMTEIELGALEKKVAKESHNLVIDPFTGLAVPANLVLHPNTFIPMIVIDRIAYPLDLIMARIQVAMTAEDDYERAMKVII